MNEPQRYRAVPEALGWTSYAVRHVSHKKLGVSAVGWLPVVDGSSPSSKAGVLPTSRATHESLIDERRPALDHLGSGNLTR